MKVSIKYCVLSIVGILFLSLPLILTVHAADSTPSADIQKQLKVLEQEIASKAAKLKTQISRKMQNKAFVGVIQNLTKDSINISTGDGIKTISVNQDSDFESDYPKIKSTSVNSTKDLKVQMKVAALGDVDDTGVLAARRVVVQTPDDPTKIKTILWGQVSSIDKNLATIKDKDGKNWQVSLVKIDSTAKVNDFIIATGFMDKDQKKLIAEFLYVILAEGASPSPSPIKSATPSAKASPKSTK